MAEKCIFKFPNSIINIFQGCLTTALVVYCILFINKNLINLNLTCMFVFTTDDVRQADFIRRWGCV